VILLHAELFEFGFAFAFGIKSSKVGFEFLDEEFKVQKPYMVKWVQEGGFKTI